MAANMGDMCHLFRIFSPYRLHFEAVSSVDGSLRRESCVCVYIQKRYESSLICRVINVPLLSFSPGRTMMMTRTTTDGRPSLFATDEEID